ncbi:hypothetical protein Deipe_2062 [Deinococcus peraridilitoris DSM 19664]|uniref:Uncharacterized protein n=2 Tax=Deinococcus TaxID=1298 RepID=L0A0Y3_DEIPD|nr:hypothetical protein Deipe_2062 [Deinococcus peraridilitoris DSM 19664]
MAPQPTVPSNTYDLLWRALVIQTMTRVSNGEGYPITRPNATYGTPGESRGFPQWEVINLYVTHPARQGSLLLTCGCRYDLTRVRYSAALSHLTQQERTLIALHQQGIVGDNAAFEAYEALLHSLGLDIEVLSVSEYTPRAQPGILEAECVPVSELITHSAKRTKVKLS